MPGRHCGSCTACCEGWITSTNIRMSPGSPCAHCTSGGCAIYTERPENPCRTFECGWLREGSPLPDHFRPDQCGAIVVFDQEILGMKVFAAAPTGAEIPAQTMNWLQDFARKQSLPMLFWENEFQDGRFLGQKQQGYGPPAFQQAVRSSRNLEVKL